MTASPTTDQLADRIHRLERRQRWMMTTLALGAVACITLALRPPPSNEVKPEQVEPLRIRHLQLVDAQNRVRGEWKLDEGHPTFTLLDEEGKQRLILVHDDEQTGFFALDDEERVRVGAAQFSHGGGGFALHGPKLNGAAVLYLKGDGSLTLYDAKGKAAHRWPDNVKENDG